MNNFIKSKSLKNCLCNICNKLDNFNRKDDELIQYLEEIIEKLYKILYNVDCHCKE